MSKVKKLLDESRKKLLDLSLRNPLINYNLKRKNRLIIVDELPNVMYKKLLDAEIMKFEPVPYPEIDESEENIQNEEIDEVSGFTYVKKHAQILGISIDEEVPYVESDSKILLDKHKDNAIQTLHYPDALEQMLRKRRSDANSAIQEKGTNILYLAIGFLQWKQSINSEKILNSPLILIPIQIERGKPDKVTGVYTYNLVYTGEDLVSNISLRHKINNEFGIKLPEFNEEDTPEEYFKKINHICENNKNLIGVSRRFALDFFQFNKLLMYLDLESSNWPEDRKIEEHPILAEIAGEIDSPEQSMVFEEIPEDETENLGLVMDADGSQRDAIAQVMRGHNLIIEGPPGTGKSQTIANLIAVALSEGKSVLFVAEKLVALEVVKKRLDAVGLGNFILELHSHKANKANFYTSLRERVDLEVSLSSDELEQSIENIEHIKQRINDYLNVLHTPQEIIGQTPYIIFGEVLNREQEAFLNVPSENKFLNIDQKMLQDLKNELGALELLIKENQGILNSRWNGLETTNAISLDTGVIIELLQEYRDKLQDMSALFEEDNLLRVVPQTEEMIKIIDKANNSEAYSEYPDPEKLRIVNSFSIDKIKNLMHKTEELIERSSFFDEIDMEMVESIDNIRQLSRVLRGFKDISFWGKLFNKEYKNAKKQFNLINIKEKAKNAEQMSNVLDKYRHHIEKYLQEFKNYYKDGGEYLMKEMGLDTIDLNNIKALGKTREYLDLIIKLNSAYQWKERMIDNGFSEELLKPFETEDQQNYVDALVRVLLKAKPILEELLTLKNTISQYVNINENIFFNNAKEFNTRYAILEEKITNTADLGAWIDVSRLLSTLNDYGLSEILRYIVQHDLADKLKDIVLYAYYREWAHKILRDNVVLAQFNKHLYETSLKNFRELDNKLGSLYAKKHAFELSKNIVPAGTNGRVSEKTEMRLIQNEIRKQKRHLPIRQTLKRASKAIRALKPCYMMSPLSVSQFIDPMQEPFDLMIMDEASQIFPEDSLGAIARAKQVVVVGDPNQLPPTNFFSSSMKEDDIQDETVVTSAESILDLMLRVYPHVKRLKWHYRSRHESLIAFSNHHFYDSELMIFPSPERDTSQVGISRKFISNGFFKEQKNTNEAIAIVDAICEHLKANPVDSLGAVAMNKKQAELIDRLLEEKTKEDINIRRLLDLAINKGKFFIKNLENVQGDEADILYIGTTYGPDPESKKVYQRFGPINGDHGWRRMNVLITRARKKIVVFTSMVSNDIIPVEGNRGRMALRNYLKYIESGHVESIQGTTTGKEPDSPFEESVIRFIQSLGFVAHPQVGVAGFFIDIGVMVEGSYNYIIGIECDGAGYHSSKSARDRDRIRQEILESMGWHIHRIWSTDWFKHRKEEELRLQKVLAEAKNRAVLIKEEMDEPKKEEAILENRGVDTNDRLSNKNSAINNRENSIVSDKDTLTQRLLKFREEIVSKKYAINSRSILSDRMIELLVNNKPLTLEEFRMCIPKYLREKIDYNQMEYIDQIFEILEDG